MLHTFLLLGFTSLRGIVLQRKFILLYIVMLFLGSCASVQAPKSMNAGAAKVSAHSTAFTGYPPYSGEKFRLQILRFEVPAQAAQAYPELQNKKVGWGLYNRLIDEIYATGRFTLLEEKDQMQSKILEQWALSQSGIVVQEQQINTPGLQMPQYILYAEVYDFAVSTTETVIGIKSETQKATNIGIQLKLVHVATGEYIPASAMGSATTIGTGVWILPNMDFNQSTVGLATQNAVQNALLQLIHRMSGP
jgi:curli biogenesis system outer membrane secretion channel CsgG